jgi:hypothetical protein
MNFAKCYIEPLLPDTPRHFPFLLVNDPRQSGNLTALLTKRVSPFYRSDKRVQVDSLTYVNVLRWLRSSILFLILFSAFTNAQSPFSVPGITGLLFMETDTSYTVAVTDSFWIQGVRIQPDSLTLKFDKPAGRFVIFGRAKAVVEDTMLSIGLGKADDPGIVIMSRSLTLVRFFITRPFKLKALTFVPDSLWFSWKSDTTFAMHGSLSVIISTDTVKVSAGSVSNPGIVIAGGKLTKLQLLTSAKFSIKTLTFIPDSLGFAWLADSSFAMHGSLSVIVSTDTIKLSAGSVSNPGITFIGGRLTKLELLANGKFSIKALTIIPDSLGFRWLADSSFAMHGSLSVLVAADSIKVSAGTVAKPGILYTGGKLTKLELSASGKFSIKSLTFMPDSLGVVYHEADSSLAMHGSLSLMVASDSIKVSAGTQQNPGIVISAGKLKSLNLTASAKFSIKSVMFIPDSLGVVYHEADSSLAMHGSLTLMVASDSIKVSAGTQQNPGIVISAGKLKSLNLTASAKFSIKSVTLIPDSLGIIYREADSSFVMHGSLALMVASDTIKVSAGTEQKPGIIIAGGKLKSLSLTASAKFSIKSVTLIPDSLGVVYHEADSSLAMHGSLTLMVASDSIKVKAGTEQNPGIITSNGQLKQMRLLASAKFNIKSVTLVPDSLGIIYRSSDTTFTMYGSLGLMVASDTIKVRAGTEQSPGIVVTSGKLKSLNLTASAKFSIKSVMFIPDSLGVVYHEADSSLAMHGSLTLMVASDSIKMAVGTEQNPGIVVKNGQFTKLQLLASAKFSIKALIMVPDSLGFSLSSDSSFTMYGSLTLMVATDTIKVSAGTVQNPGIVIERGRLTKLQLAVSTQFSFKGITVTPQGIGFTWISDTTNTFTLYGAVSVNVNGSFLKASFGTSVKPGFVIVNGTVTRWALSLTDTLRLPGLNIALTDASLAYDAEKHIFSMWGSATVGLSRDTVTLSLGTENQPGLRVVDGKVTSVTAGVTASFKVGGLTLSPDHLTFAWDDSTQSVKLYGSLSATFDGSVTTFLAGTKEHPGIMIVNGAVKSLSLGVSADLRIASLVVTPRGLTFVWADSGFFKLYGNATMKMASDSISVMLGDSINPGMLIVGNTLEHFNVGVTADFNLKSLRIQPKALTFRYDKPTSSFSLYGGIAVKLAGDSIAAILGDSARPGVVYANGTVKQVHIGISAGFGLKGLSIKTDSLTFVWSSDSNYYALYGGARISIGGDSIGCDFGTARQPGLIVKEGQLIYLSLNVNSDIKIGNIEVKVKDLDLVYEKSQYTLKGTCSIKQVFSVSLTLGSGNTPGIILDVSSSTPRLQVNDLLFEISHANLGAIDLKDFQIAIKNGQIAYSTVDIAFPGGWEVGAGIAFKGSPAQIDSIGVDWMATSIQSAIALPNGMLLVGMKGSLKNLSNPSALTFAGDVLLLYGGPVTIDGREGALLYLRTGVTISCTGMTLAANAKVGAYQVDANWYSVFGEGTLTLAVAWGSSAKLDGDFVIPSPPNKIVEIKPLVYLDAHKNFDALMDVTFYAPGWIPFVGGQELGGADGAMRYRNGDLWHSYAAAWVSGNTCFIDWTVGAKYNFASREISGIGGGEVSDIHRDIDDDTKTSLARSGRLAKVAGRSVRSIVHSFTTSNPSPTALVVSIQWPAKVDSTVITVLGPEGFYEITRVEKMSEGDLLAVYKRSQKIERDFAVISGDSIATFIVAPYASFTYDSTVNALLPPGQYQVVCTSYDVHLDSVGFNVIPMYKPPKADIWLTTGPVVNVKYSSMQMDSTYVDIYVSDNHSYTGRIIRQFAQNTVGKDGTARVDTIFKYNTQDQWVGQGDSLWFYAVIEDRLNPPFLTKIVGPYYMPPALRGNITVTEGVDTVTTGLLVFIDEDKDGSWDTPTTGGLEIHSVTDAGGKFRIPALPEGTHQIRVIVPPGYMLLSDNQPVTSLPIDYRGLPLELNLKLKPGVYE